MKQFKGIATFVIMTIIFTFLNVQNIEAEEKFEIDRLEVVVKVHEDGTYDVRENYIINYTRPSLGIYRDIPTVYNMEFYDLNENKVDKTFRFPVTDISVEGEVFDVDSQFNGERIIIGPESGPQYTGIREFSVMYKVHTQPLNLESQHEAFFQNLVSSWKTPVHEFAALVTFDKDIDLSELVVKGKSRTGEFPVDCIIGDNEFSCFVYDSVLFGEHNGITAQVPLPDDYFVRLDSGNMHTFSFMAAGLLVVAALVLKALYGKRVPIIEKVTFYAPEGFNSPMVGYVYKEHAQINDLYTLLFEWANKGFIRIHEDEDEGMTFEKIKDLKTTESFEETIFNTMFYKEGVITIDDWTKQNIYTALMALIGNVSKAVNQKGDIYNRQSTRLKRIVVTLTFIVMAIFSFNFFNFSLMSVFPSFIVLAIMFVIQVLPYGVFTALHTKYVKQNKTTLIGLLALVYIAMSLLMTYGAILISSQFLGLLINTVSYLIFIGLLNIVLIVATMIKVRTQYGADLYGEVTGLYNFIKYAKKDELLMMQEENPHLYYDVLPYAQVFGMSNVWLKQFKDIEIPTSPYYTTYRPTTFNNYILMRSLTSSMNTMSRQVMPKVSSGTGGGSFSGGGFSGGGFSGGGGFGGGGGGSR